ncbi:response regulator transcription factor [Actinocrispum sp. NPDC049592]|uniref:response regulator transcription factor n=1 Tax=Actinocrispum sp. NPDC049592 TaxID=3154835 RepID=UPI003434546E
MGRLRRPDLPGGPAADFFHALYDLHLRAGEPSIRDIAKSTNQLSHDTVHRTLTGPAVPKWANVEKVVQALGGSPETIQPLWLAARVSDDGQPAPDLHVKEPTNAADAVVPDVSDASPAPGRIRVMIVDDHPLFRYGLAAVLAHAGYEVVAEAENGAEAVELAAKSAPDVVLMDLHMPVMSGVEATRQLVERNPAARVLVLTMFDDTESIRSSLRAGAKGYLLKGTGQEQIVDAVRRTALGEPVLSATASEAMLAHYREADDQPPTLTSREQEVVRLVAQDMTNRDIATALMISLRTVEMHLVRALKKLGLRSRVGLTRYAIEHGLTD